MDPADPRRGAPEIHVFDDPTSWVEGAAGTLALALAAAVAARGRAALALAGGSTPRPVYARLAAAPFSRRIDWSRIDVFWGDERCVPPEHPASNYRAAREALLAPVGAPAERVHRVPGELGAAGAAASYGEELVRVLGQAPRFDLVLLGLGEDGHTASLFPGAPALAADGLAVATASPEQPYERVSLTLPVINAARLVLFLVTGEAKAAAVAEVFRARAEGAADGGATGPVPPAALVEPADGLTLWYLDGPAAGRVHLPPERPPA